MRIRYGCLVLAALLATGTAGADWLVLEDGTRMETKGPWDVKGRLVVFTGVDGALASLRASDIDLEASKLATESAEAEAELLKSAREQGAPEISEPPRKPVLVLTDADVAHVDPDEEESSEGEPEAGEEQSLRVVSWDQESSEEGDGVTVTGILRNDGSGVASNIQVGVQVLDADGQVLGTQQAQVSSKFLNTGELLNFRVLFSEVQGFDTARFDISSRSFRASAPAGTPSASEPDGDSEPAFDDFPEADIGTANS